MMPVLRVNDPTFDGLKIISRWWGTQTPSDTIDRLVQEKMAQLGIERDDEPEVSAIADAMTGGTTEAPTTASSSAVQFDAAPGLAFTKPITASINGKALHNPRWASILLAMIAQVKAKGVKDLVSELAIRTKAEQYEEEGYTYYPELGISVQGQSASDAWKEVDRLAKKWRIPVSVEFFWRQDPKAQYPGKRGVLRSGNT